MEQKLSPGVQRYVDGAKELVARRAEFRAGVRKLKFDTIAVHGAYGADEVYASGNGGVIEPIFPSTSQAYRDSDEMEAGLGYLIPTWCYSRIHNPTVFYLEETLALLESYGCEDDASGLCTASGMSAIKQAVEPLVALSGAAGEAINFVSAAQVYGGSFQLFNVRMRERGAHVRWVTEPWDIEAWRGLVDENTRFLYAEMPSNPQQSCFDVAAVAKLAHSHGIPLIVDSTIATPALMRPLQHGADVVVHSLTKTVGAGGFTIGGGIVARHNLTSRHLADEAKANYALWLKLWPFRDSGSCMSAHSAFFLLNELRTLRLKIGWMSANTMTVARFLEQHPKVERVDYLGLPHHRQHELASRYLRLVDDGTPAFGHLMSFNIAGSAADTRRFFDALQRIYRATDLGRIKSVATLPAISTHAQQGEEGRKLAGIPPTMVRLCVGGEHPDDVIADLDQALRQI
ncbi:MAG: aminotransferase class I/II-fold pyridoxal phosphate-dependent enzyme [Thermoanaerobaculaceae bacterium]|jgi:O-acetylhomoserine/O-acetylserine sulfhydrylase-like pyridoxal-dependent enzyme